jgi:hypothetical protein
VKIPLPKIGLSLMTTLMVCSSGYGQTTPQTEQRVSPPPATKMEAFKPAAGSLVTFGYNELGKISRIAVDVRELKGLQGSPVRGVVVEVTQDEYHRERSFVDADEIEELLKGLEALLAVTANPTPFENFEIQYTTKGELEISVYNGSYGDINYSVEAGRTLKARRLGLERQDIHQLKALFEAAQQKLYSLNVTR